MGAAALVSILQGQSPVLLCDYRLWTRDYAVARLAREVTPHRPGLRGSFHERAIGCASGAYCRDRTATLGEVQGCRRSRGAGALVPWVRRHKWQLARGDPDALRNLTD